MLIDTHNHVNWLGYGPEKIIENMDRNNIDITWLLSWEAPLDEIDQEMYMSKFFPGQNCMPLEHILEALRRFPDRFVAGYCPDPRQPAAVDRLLLAVSEYNVRVCGELKVRMMFDNLDALKLYRVCAQHHLPVVVHIDYPVPTGKGSYPRPDYWYGGGLEPFENALRKCPETVFIGHGPGFWGHISNDNAYLQTIYPKDPVQPGGDLYRLLREYPHLYADLSAGSACNALSRDKEVGKAFIIEFQDRLLFARDGFTDDLMNLLRSLALPMSVEQKIFGDNAAALLSRRET